MVYGALFCPADREKELKEMKCAGNNFKSYFFRKHGEVFKSMHIRIHLKVNCVRY